MSKRFGRNQKRRMRERIQDLESEVDTLKNEIRMLRRFGWENEYAVERTAQVLGSNFITLLPGITDADARDLDRWRHPIPSVLGASFSERAQFVHETIDYIEADLMKGNYRFDPLRRCIHLGIDFQGERVAYALSDYALQIAPDDHLVKCMAQEMAPLLLTALKQREGVRCALRGSERG